MWHNGVGGISAVPGCRFSPWLAQWVKDPLLLQLCPRWQLWLRSDPWPGNSICHGVAKKKKHTTRSSSENKNLSNSMNFWKTFQKFPDFPEDISGRHFSVWKSTEWQKPRICLRGLAGNRGASSVLEAFWGCGFREVPGVKQRWRQWRSVHEGVIKILQQSDIQPQTQTKPTSQPMTRGDFSKDSAGSFWENSDSGNCH